MGILACTTHTRHPTEKRPRRNRKKKSKRNERERKKKEKERERRKPPRPSEQGEGEREKAATTAPALARAVRRRSNGESGTRLMIPEAHKGRHSSVPRHSPDLLCQSTRKRTARSSPLGQRGFVAAQGSGDSSLSLLTPHSSFTAPALFRDPLPANHPLFTASRARKSLALCVKSTCGEVYLCCAPPILAHTTHPCTTS
jgi:hypothetical protein